MMPMTKNLLPFLLIIPACVPAQVIAPASGGTAKSYVGLIATRGDLNNSNVGTGTTWGMDRSYHIARQTIPANGMKIVWGNYYVNGSNVEVGAGTGTFKASVEYPAGTITACTFGGASTVNIAASLDATTDACGPAIPNGAGFWIRMLYVNTAGGLVFSSGNYSTTIEGFLFGSGTPNDLTGGGAVASGGGVGFHPLAIVGTTTFPSVCLVGDSRTVGYGDMTLDSSLDIGETARTIGPVFAYTKLAVFGTSENAALANFTARSRIAKYCSHAIDEYGINDLAGGQTAAQVVTSRTSMVTLLGIPTFETTLPAETASTDSWATTTNQTVNSNTNGTLTTFNASVRSGIANAAGYFDIYNAVDPLALNKWPVSKIVGATSGTANFATTDGTHETTVMNQLIQQSGVVNVNAINLR